MICVCQDFRAGMNLYLCRHQYSNTFTEDLWAALEEASSKPVASVMSTWTKQMGFPVITVESVSQEGNRRTFTLTQAKFCADSKDVQNGMLVVVLKKILTSAKCFRLLVFTVASDRLEKMFKSRDLTRPIAPLKTKDNTTVTVNVTHTKFLNFCANMQGY